jgi:hypothetical protein
MSIPRAKRDGMARLWVCLLVGIAVALPGCKAPPPAATADVADVHRADFLDNSPPATHSAAWQWSADHTVALCTGAVLVVVVGAAALTGLALASVFGPFL